MDTKTLNLNLGDDEFDKVKEVLRRMGEFIAYFEIAENKMDLWKQEVEQSIIAHQQHINEQITEIQKSTEALKEFMTEAGVARLRISSEKMLGQGQRHIKALEAAGQSHLKSLETQNEVFSKLAKKTFERLDRASNYTVKNLSEAISSFRINDFQKLTDSSRQEIEKTSNSAIYRLSDMVKWFHWKNLALAAAITLVTSLTIGLYLNDQMPWEIHKSVVMERHAGQALINAWPSLSQSEQQQIINSSKKSLF